MSTTPTQFTDDLHRTEEFGFALPNVAGVPEFTHKWDRGGYRLTDPTQVGVRGTRKVTLLADGTVANVLNDLRGLAKHEAIAVAQQLLLDPAMATSTDPGALNDPEYMSRLYEAARKRSFSQKTKEWAQAMTAWINAVDYEILSVHDVPAMFQPYVQAYVRELERYGLTFDPELSRRLITSAGADGVTPEDCSAIVCHTNRVYRLPSNQCVSLRLTTSEHPEYRMAGFAASAGIARRAHRMLGRGGAASWDVDILPAAKWEETIFGVISLPRTPGVDGQLRCVISCFDDEHCDVMAHAALQTFNAKNAGTTLLANRLVPVDPVCRDIAAAESLTELRELWAQYSSTGQWDESVHTPLAFDRASQLQ